MLRRFLETIVLVEPLRTVVEGMNKQGTDTGVLRNGYGPVDGVLQQSGPKFDALDTMIDSQSRQNHHRDGVGHVPSHTARGHLVRDGPGRHRVVAADTAILICDDEGTAGTTQLVGQRPAFEPFVEAGFAASESIKRCRASSGCGALNRKVHVAPMFQGTFTAMRRSSPGLGLGGASSIAMNCLNLSASRLKKT